MCDTMVALGNSTLDGSILFAKNSDREPNEPHELLVLPRKKYPNATGLRCTYVTIRQASESFAVLLAKPYWIWGAEMGANEHGVAIGNEALFTKVPNEKRPGLTGMDLLRLALERADRAKAALRVITDLLERHGQAGNCGFARPTYYHNSFIIADSEEAWVLETAGQNWAAKRVADIYCISNAITIEKDWDMASENLVSNAIERGWCKNRRDFDFSHCYTDVVQTFRAYARYRRRSATQFLNEYKGNITVATFMEALRHHGAREQRRWPWNNLLPLDVCMHFGYGPIKIGQTAGSMVSKLTADSPTHWVTGTALPCKSIFKPAWIESGLLPQTCESEAGRYDERNGWWLQERLNRALLSAPKGLVAEYSRQKQAVEKSFLDSVLSSTAETVQQKRQLTARCFSQARDFTVKWIRDLQAAPAQKTKDFFYAARLRKLNKQAQLPLGN